MKSNQKITIAGAGLVGSFLAVVLARKGYSVDVYDGLPDSRLTDIYQGRSINLALSSRGWKALESIGLDDEIRKEAIPMYQRVIHSVEGTLSYQPYGKAGEAIYSVSRVRMNQQLMNLAEKEDNANLYFQHQLTGLNFQSMAATFTRPDKTEIKVNSDYLFGADGSNSKVRRLMQEQPRISFSLEFMPMSYIELNISANDDGTHKLAEVEALHIWSRGDFMLIALPNTDGSFTCTLFLNYEGEISFKALQTEADIQNFYETYFADVLPLLDTPVYHFLTRIPCPLALIDIYPWVLNNTCLIGDACHAIVPFYGQGMNCGLEDCRILDELIEENNGDWDRILPAFQESRKPNAEAIASLSKMNFVEMSDLTSKPEYLLRKKIESKFNEMHPELWTTMYSMVTFSPDTPYKDALDNGLKQQKLMDEIMTLPNIEDEWKEDHVYQKIKNLLLNA